MNGSPESNGPIRWTTSDRGLRYYEPAQGHEVRESSLATHPHLWVDDEHLSVEQAVALRDDLPPGRWRETLTTAIEGHYQARQPQQGWKAGDPCALCGSTDTTLENDVAACNGCGASEGDR